MEIWTAHRLFCALLAISLLDSEMTMSDVQFSSSSSLSYNPYVVTEGNDSADNRRAQVYLNKMMTGNANREIAKQCADIILAKHDDEYGDVWENQYVVNLTSGLTNNFSCALVFSAPFV